MNRYALFIGSDYYPGGGMSDYAGSYASIEEAKAEAHRLIDETDEQIDWAQIADKVAMISVVSGRYHWKWVGEKRGGWKWTPLPEPTET